MELIVDYEDETNVGFINTRYRINRYYKFQQKIDNLYLIGKK